MNATRLFRRALLLCAPLAAGIALSGCGAGMAPTTNSPTPLKITYGGALTGQLTVAYSGSFSVSGGTSPYRCTLTNGTLPSGLTLNASACTLTGTPTGTDTGSYALTVTASDSGSTQQSASTSFTLVISPAPFVITTTTLPTGAVGSAYSGTVLTSGGTAPVTCKLASGATNGLVVNSNCTITGSPIASGTTSFSVQATDSGSPAQTATGTVSATILSGANTRVSSGSTPMVGATVQIYAAGTNGNGSTATALLSSPMVTDSNGIFTLPASSTYTCPSATAVVYLVATGGKLGANGVSAPAAAFMASPGACSTLATTSSLVLDEASTAASAYAFAQFLTAGATPQMGATSTNLTGLSAAAATANNLVPAATGLAASLGTASSVSANGAGGVTAQGKVNLLANILNACVVGGSSSTACTTLFTATTAGGTVPTNTLWAAVNLVQHPATAVAALYALVPASPVYTPTASSAPTDWTLAVTYSGGGLNHPAGLAIDSIGRLWIANDAVPGSASLFTNLGAPVFASGITGNGLYDAFAVAVDGNDTAYITNFDGGFSSSGSLTAISKTGASVSGFPTNSAGIFYPFGVAIDTTGLLWVADYGDVTVSLVNSNGSAYGSYQSALFNFPLGIAVDGNHNGWAANASYTTVTRVSQDGKSITAFNVGSGPYNVSVDANNNVWVVNYISNSVALVTGAGVVKSTYPGYTDATISSPENLSLDGNGNVWVINYHGNSITELAGASASTPGAVLSPAKGWGYDTQIPQAYGSGIDRSGNVWVASQANNTLTEFVGMAAPTKTPVIGPVVKP